MGDYDVSMEAHPLKKKEKGTILVGLLITGGIWEISLPSPQFFGKPKIALKE